MYIFDADTGRYNQTPSLYTVRVYHSRNEALVGMCKPAEVHVPDCWTWRKAVQTWADQHLEPGTHWVRVGGTTEQLTVGQ